MGTKRIPFDLNTWLSDKSQKVVWGDGTPADIENIELHFLLNTDDLFLVTDEPELTEFEEAVSDLCWRVGMGEAVKDASQIKREADKLLSIARKQIEKNYLESPEAFKKRTDAVYAQGIKYGKAEALKDLPKWKKCKESHKDVPVDYYLNGHNQLVNTQTDKYISLDDLEKLPKE